MAGVSYKVSRAMSYFNITWVLLGQHGIYRTAELFDGTEGLRGKLIYIYLIRVNLLQSVGYDAI